MGNLVDINRREERESELCSLKHLMDDKKGNDFALKHQIISSKTLKKWFICNFFTIVFYMLKKN